MGMGGPIFAVAAALAMYAYVGGSWEGGQGVPSTAGPGAGHYVEEIVRAADDNGVGRDGAVIGVGTALVETDLRMLANPRVPDSLDYPHEGLGYDHDSVGLFQQRDNGSWGSVNERMDAYESADLFFDAMKRDVPNWEHMSPGAVAQKVQSSAYPGRYALRMGEARDLVAAHGNS